MRARSKFSVKGLQSCDRIERSQEVEHGQETEQRDERRERGRCHSQSSGYYSLNYSIERSCCNFIKVFLSKLHQ